MNNNSVAYRVKQRRAKKPPVADAPATDVAAAGAGDNERQETNDSETRAAAAAGAGDSELIISEDGDNPLELHRVSPIEGIDDLVDRFTSLYISSLFVSADFLHDFINGPRSGDDEFEQAQRAIEYILRGLYGRNIPSDAKVKNDLLKLLNKLAFITPYQKGNPKFQYNIISRELFDNDSVSYDSIALLEHNALTSGFGTIEKIKVKERESVENVLRKIRYGGRYTLICNNKEVREEIAGKLFEGRNVALDFGNRFGNVRYKTAQNPFDSSPISGRTNNVTIGFVKILLKNFFGGDYELMNRGDKGDIGITNRQTRKNFIFNSDNFRVNSVFEKIEEISNSASASAKEFEALNTGNPCILNTLILRINPPRAERTKYKKILTYILLKTLGDIVMSGITSDHESKNFYTINTDVQSGDRILILSAIFKELFIDNRHHKYFLTTYSKTDDESKEKYYYMNVIKNVDNPRAALENELNRIQLGMVFLKSVSQAIQNIIDGGENEPSEKMLFDCLYERMEAFEDYSAFIDFKKGTHDGEDKNLLKEIIEKQTQILNLYRENIGIFLNRSEIYETKLAEIERIKQRISSESIDTLKRIIDGFKTTLGQEIDSYELVFGKSPDIPSRSEIERVMNSLVTVSDEDLKDQVVPITEIYIDALPIDGMLDSGDVITTIKVQDEGRRRSRRLIMGKNIKFRNVINILQEQLTNLETIDMNLTGVAAGTGQGGARKTQKGGSMSQLSLVIRGEVMPVSLLEDYFIQLYERGYGSIIKKHVYNPSKKEENSGVNKLVNTYTFTKKNPFGGRRKRRKRMTKGRKRMKKRGINATKKQKNHNKYAKTKKNK